MTHPHNLHATRAAGSLNTARTQLDNAVAHEATARRAEARTIAAAGAIQAWRPMSGPTGQGGHGDLVGRTAVSTLEPEVRDGHLARLAASTTATLTWLADNLDGRSAAASFGMDPLARIQALTTRLRPSTSRELTLWLDEADQQIRKTLRMEPDRALLAGLACPRCGARQLWLHTAAPTYARIVTCEAGADGCRCAGDNCLCRMSIRVAGVHHIWPANAWPITRTVR